MGAPLVLAEQYERMEQETVSGLRRTNIFLRLVLFLFTLIIVGAAAGLFFAVLEDDYFRADRDAGQAHRASEQLNALREKLSLTATSIVAGGEVADAVARQASELSADVPIAGRGAAAGRLGRLRSQALNIIGESPCPVITV